MKRDAALLFAVSVLLALALWLQVGFQDGLASSRELSVRLQLRNIPSDLIATSAPNEVRVLAEGATSSLDALDVDALVAEVDLRDGVAGSHSYPIELNAPTRARLQFSLRNTVTSITLEPIANVERPVEVQTRGTRPSGLRYDGAALEPERVAIIGPTSSIDEVRRVQVTLDLTRLRPGTSFVLDVEVLDARNRPIRFVRSEPSRVTVYPAVAAAPATTNLPINAIWRGQVEFGFEIVRWEMRPSQVSVTGNSAALAAIDKIDTEPIDISALAAPTTLRTRLRIPPGLTATSPTQVQVSLDIRAAARAEESEEAPPGKASP